MSRYLVGIDLGTTHTVVAYADSKAPAAATRILPIDQLVARGEVGQRPLLGSVRYHPAPGELAATDLVLPWQPDGLTDPVPGGLIGALAQELGAKVPGRLVSSAKSWLSHPGVDRRAPILPWGAPQEIPRISPLEASAGYLRHVRQAWNHRFASNPLEAQDLVLTVPASFDEVARRLTVEAARLAALPRVRLVEEPQAACYDWLARHADSLDGALAGIGTVLVCDVGGGTTDLTLIRVEHGGEHPQLVRIGVGEHLMLGGDNMDLALAHLAERRLMGSGARLGAAQLSQLVQHCRSAKERLLAADAPQSASVTLLGAGARLVGHARSTELSRHEVQKLIVDGFFPRSGPNEGPQRRRGGIVEFGLPYAADPAISRHLAAFLADQEGEQTPTQQVPLIPDALLLNGGVFRSEALSNRLLEILGSWRGSPPRLLHNDQPELSVARGAVAYALARRGRGPRIGGGAPRSLLLLVDETGTPTQPQRAVCLLPRGTEEGQELRLSERLFSLRLGQPVRFGLVAAIGSHSLRPGELVEVEADHFRTLPPLATVIDRPPGTDSDVAEVPVQLAAVLTDVGTLEIDCVATDQAPTDCGHRWRMEFQLRGQDSDATQLPQPPLPASLPQALERIERLYGARVAGVDPKEIKRLQRDLERLLGRRGSWDTPLLRELFAALWDGAKRRRRSADHERLWFNLVGFSLRPGYGYPLDDWRLHQLWSIYAQGVQYRNEARNLAEWWTLWRRVAGGLDGARQLRLLEDVQGQLRASGRRAAKAEKGPAADHIVRLVAGLERLPPERKVALGKLLIGVARRPTESPQRWWALGRLGARVPLYAGAHDLVPRDTAALWIEQLLGLDWQALEPAAFAVAQLARLSGDRDRDLAPELRARVIQRLRKEKAPEKWIAMVQAVTELDEADQSLMFGEALPPGLRLVR